MTIFDILTICIAGLYFVGSLLYLVGLISHGKLLRKAALGITVAGFLLHTLELFTNLAGFGPQTLSQGQFYFSLLAWCFLLIYLLVGWHLRLQFLALTAAPLALILFSSSLAVSTEKLPMPGSLSGLWFGMHIGTLFLSIALLALAFGAGLVYLYLERKIKTKERIGGWKRELPSLSSFDRANHFAVALGFPLYTFGLLSGFLWAHIAWKQVFSWDPKEIATVVIWFLFAYLFYQRIVLGWKGKKPAKMAIWVFLFTLISLVGINFFLPTHHTFQP